MGFNTKKTYDLIFSAGEACFCSILLRKELLQVESFPFDWLGGSNFSKKCEILTTNFDRFFEKEDLIACDGETNENSFAYKNTYSNIVFKHDFPKNLSFDESYELAKEKYNRRIERLYNRIKESKSVLIVFMEIPVSGREKIADNELIELFNSLRDCFGEKINVLYLENSLSENSKMEITQGLTKITCNYKDTKSECDHASNKKVIRKILKQYRLKLPLLYRLKMNLIRLILNIIPDEKSREHIRKKYHIY